MISRILAILLVAAACVSAQMPSLPEGTPKECSALVTPIIADVVKELETNGVLDIKKAQKIAADAKAHNYAPIIAEFAPVITGALSKMTTTNCHGILDCVAATIESCATGETKFNKMACAQVKEAGGDPAVIATFLNAHGYDQMCGAAAQPDGGKDRFIVSLSGKSATINNMMKSIQLDLKPLGTKSNNSTGILPADCIALVQGDDDVIPYATYATVMSNNLATASCDALVACGASFKKSCDGTPDGLKKMICDKIDEGKKSGEETKKIIDAFLNGDKKLMCDADKKGLNPVAVKVVKKAGVTGQQAITKQIEAVEAALGHKKPANHTVLYIAIGAGALVLIGVLLFCLCKPSKKSANSVALMQNQAQYANMA